MRVFKDIKWRDKKVARLVISDTLQCHCIRHTENKLMNSSTLLLKIGKQQCSHYRLVPEIGMLAVLHWTSCSTRSSTLIKLHSTMPWYWRHLRYPLKTEGFIMPSIIMSINNTLSPQITFWNNICRCSFYFEGQIDLLLWLFW